jgi:heterotetrameric sarcosine oxidase delta subunit
MLLIECPFCGPRDELEFRCAGQSHIVRPCPAEEVSDECWGIYLFARQNSKGIHYERWFHAYGCRRWFNVARDTTSHEIVSVYGMVDPNPAAGDTKVGR